ncbi:Phosphatidylserine decarboxylase proenzyme 2 [Mycena sanguinolenta]|uniref:Phosphatidylserine decarboxylase proenzyme 2 n=1 Tax=Mycena sanguinolenta TaxID=230812 RepID=A0A8H7D6G9_9AGAR|nr:Phosphatidylserine decarboxylase proenzyme 2 [Mycena sanguinolenta]
MTVKKHPKLRRALKLPFHGRAGATASGRNAFMPRQGEQPIVFLRVQVLGGNNLLAKDRNGFSDPFVVASLLHTRHQTAVAKKTVNPVYAPKDATWDFPIYLSVADKLGVVELVVWDKDMLRKDYLGEAGIAVEDWFTDSRSKAWDAPDNVVRLCATRRRLLLNFTSLRSLFSAARFNPRLGTPAQGTIQLRLGFVAPPPPTVHAPNQAPVDFDVIYRNLVKNSRKSLVSAPPTEGVGTIRSNIGPAFAEFEDDGGLSSSSASENEEGDSDEEDECEECDSDDDDEGAEAGVADAGDADAGLDQQHIPTPTHLQPPDINITPGSPATDEPDTGKTPTGPSPFTTPTPSSSGAVPATATTDMGAGEGRPTMDKKRPSFIALPLPRKFLSRSRPTTPGEVSIGSASATPDKEAKERKKRFRRSWSGAGTPLEEGADAGTTMATSSKGKGKSKKGKEKQQQQDAGAGKESQQKQSRKERRKPQRSYSLGADVGAPGVRDNDIVGIVMLEIAGAEDLPRLKNMTRTSFDMDPFVVISFGKKVFRTRVIRHSLNPVWDEKLLFHVRRYEIGYQVRLTVLDWDKLTSNDYIGEVAFNVSDLVADAPQPLPLPPVKGGSAAASSPSLPSFRDIGALQGGSDKEDAFADAAARERGTRIPLYAEEEGGDHPMKEFKLKLEIGPAGGKEPVAWESKHKPMISFRLCGVQGEVPAVLAAARQRFWRQYLKQYDTDDTKTISHVEITSMLDSLGSTLTGSTVDSFFTRFGKDPRCDDLTVEEAIRCLETEVLRPQSERRRVDEDSGGAGPGTGGLTSINPSPVPGLPSGELRLAEMDFAGPAFDVDFAGEGKGFVTEPAEMVLLGTELHSRHPTYESSSDADLEEEESGSTSFSASPSPSIPASTPSGLTPPSLAPAALAPAPANATAGNGTATKKTRFRRPRYRKTQDSTITTASQIATVSQNGSPKSEESFERVINVKNCPLCHRPRLNAKAEVDIITHIAVCASQDWNIVDRIVVGNFVTASQAQRKFFTRMLGKISSGNYKLGANSANIIVQNRLSGQLEEEKMQVYVRLGIRLLYKGMKSRMEGGRARRLLKSMSIKQGIKYDSPESARDIPTFIEFHGLNVDEILDPLDSYKTFNQFFYRKLKPTARPVEKPDDPYRLVSAADCRLMAFESVSEATRLWIKGREFTVARLLGDAYKHEADRYTGGALAIFRLAPQDYHRFHSPVDGTIGNMTYVAGEYYTVNPQAIRTALDVYGENARKIVPINSPQFGRVMAVCVGAMMVGSIETTVKEGDTVRRGQEFGYFAFGGSTIVVLFEKDVVEWDEDLLVNGRASLETLVRVGMGIGTGMRKPLR